MGIKLRSFCGFSVLTLILCAFLGAGLGVGTYTYHYAEGLSYFSDDPRACVNCHIMRDEYDGWQHSSHHAVATCNDCHTPHDLIPKYWTKAENGFHHSKAFTYQEFHEPIMIREKNSQILEANCVACHQSLVGHILPESDREDAGAASCVRCHASVGHGPRK